MRRLLPSALVTDQGRLVQLRVGGHFYELTQEALRAARGLPDGRPGLGITIDRERLRFEFAGDEQTVELTDKQLQHRIARQLAL